MQTQNHTQDGQAENIIVMVRVKPLGETEPSDRRCITVDKNNITLDMKTDIKTFCFDYIASDKIGQEEIFERAGRSLADACIKGYNATVFAYGQTGAGKTYTVQGPTMDQVPEEETRHKQRGLMPRIFEYLLNTIARTTETDPNVEYILKCSYLEIYQEVIIDLLDPQAENLHIREDIKKGVYVENLIEETVENSNDLMEILKRGGANRHVGATAMNKESSRSHSVLTLTLESKTKHEGIINILSSRFNIIDLAGSERQKSTDAAGERLKEAGKINKSLSALGNVINSLVDISQGKSRHVHYRDSKLTFLLKDSLGGNSKTVIIANVSQNSLSMGETLSTLNFAKRAKMIKNKAVVNEDTTGTVLLLQQEIKRLKIEIAELKTKKMGGLTKTPQRSHSTMGGPTEQKSELEILLQNTVDLRASDVKMYEQISKEKDKALDVLKKCVKRSQHDKARDKMILKLKEAALTKLQGGKAMTTNEEVDLLRAENQALREAEDEAFTKIVKFAFHSDLKEQLIQKNNEQNEYILQMSGYLKDLVEEKEALKKMIEEERKNRPIGGDVEDVLAKVKLEYGEKIEDLSRKYIEQCHIQRQYKQGEDRKRKAARDMRKEG
eukprot:TRINITY_DN790_c0_g1_i2.p1 TRINITY_DN790_c0_g1~~TRINITY_DN790_c0_g1_i2.p1  ORF type:complete len:611 (-),score=94.86 TRINITY_DN790_c0_g1_i2:2558-4390(-)